MRRWTLLAAGLAAGCASLDVFRPDFDPYSKEVMLYEAACDGNSSEVAKQLAKGAPVDGSVGSEHGTPLMCAAAFGRLRTASLLLDSGANPNARRPDGMTALMDAADFGHLELAALLLGRGADVNAQVEGQTGLYAAAADGHDDVARVLLNAGARIDAPLERKGWEGWTPLMESIAQNRVGTARLLIDCGASANPASYPAGPLVLATIHGQTELVSLLVEKGADVKARMPAHWPFSTALGAARLFGRDEAASILERAGARIEPGEYPEPPAFSDPDAALKDAANREDIALARAAIGKGASQAALQEAVRRAAINGAVTVVRLLLEKGVPVDATYEKAKFTPLMYAAAAGRLEVASLLLDAGAKVDAGTIQGWTALMDATRKGHANVARLLIERGADVNAVAGAGERGGGTSTALHVAAQKGHLGVARMLLDHGAQIDAQLTDGRTPLMEAISNGRTETARLLVTRGARLDLTWTPRKLTALILAAHEGNVGLVELLIAKGAHVNARTASGDAVIPAIGGTKRYFAGRAYGRDDYGYVTSVDPALTALGTAREQGYQDVASTLVRAGAKE